MTDRHDAHVAAAEIGVGCSGCAAGERRRSAGAATAAATPPPAAPATATTAENDDDGDDAGRGRAGQGDSRPRVEPAHAARLHEAAQAASGSGPRARAPQAAVQEADGRRCRRRRQGRHKRRPG